MNARRDDQPRMTFPLYLSNLIHGLDLESVLKDFSTPYFNSRVNLQNSDDPVPCPLLKNRVFLSFVSLSRYIPPPHSESSF